MSKSEHYTCAWQEQLAPLKSIVIEEDFDGRRILSLAYLSHITR